MEKIKYLCLVILFQLLPLEIFAQIESDFEVKQLVGNKTVEITKYNGTAKNVVIPSTLYGLTVTRIGSWAFLWKGIDSVVIPNTVTVIGDNAFFGNNLTRINIPNSVKTIETAAFSVNKITSLVIPNSVTRIDMWAFQDNRITELVFPISVVSIGSNVFNKNPITKIILPANAQDSIIKKLYDEGFYNYWKSQNIAGGTYIKNGIWKRE